MAEEEKRKQREQAEIEMLAQRAKREEEQRLALSPERRKAAFREAVNAALANTGLDESCVNLVGRFGAPMRDSIYDVLYEIEVINFMIM